MLPLAGIARPKRGKHQNDKSCYEVCTDGNEDLLQRRVAFSNALQLEERDPKTMLETRPLPHRVCGRVPGPTEESDHDICGTPNTRSALISMPQRTEQIRPP